MKVTRSLPFILKKLLNRFRVFGDAPAKRSVEDIAFSVARFFSKNGSHVNYYMV